jgi:hypothetical protein
MLTVAPLVACSTIVCLNPSLLGESINPLRIALTVVGMAFFGLITVPLWLTYLPALIITPRLMRAAAQTKWFRTARLPVLIVLSLVAGAVAGALVLVPVILISLNDPKRAMIWAIAGAMAGSVTLILIVLVYRRGEELRYPVCQDWLSPKK